MSFWLRGIKSQIPKMDCGADCADNTQTRSVRRHSPSFAGLGELQTINNRPLSTNMTSPVQRAWIMPPIPAKDDLDRHKKGEHALPKKIKVSESQLLTGLFEALAISSAAASIIVLSWTWPFKSNAWSDSNLAWRSLQTSKGRCSWCNPLETLTQIFTLLVDPLQHWVTKYPQRGQTSQVTAFVVYVVAMVYLTNKRQHYRHKSNLMLMNILASVLFGAAIRTKALFISSVSIEFIPSAILLSEVTSRLLARTVSRAPRVNLIAAVAEENPTENEDKAINQKYKVVRITRQQPSRNTTFCDFCNDQSSGFRGDHELRRHIERHHAPIRRVWICRDNSKDGTFLSNCKACRNKKTYGANYNAAAHLRRAHFNPCKNKRGGTGSEERCSMGGGNLPSMDVLKDWMYEAYEANSNDKIMSSQLEPDNDISRVELKTDFSGLHSGIPLIAAEYDDFGQMHSHAISTPYIAPLPVCRLPS